MKRLMILVALAMLLSCHKEQIELNQNVASKPTTADAVQQVIDSLETAALDTLVSDRVVDEVWQGFIGKIEPNEMLSSSTVSFLGQQSVFANQLLPCFSNPLLYHNAAYAAWSEDDDGRNWYYQNKGVSPQVVQRMVKYKAAVMDKGRTFFTDPDHLWHLYLAKRNGLLVRHESLNRNQREKLAAWLEQVVSGLQAFNQGEFRSLHAAYLAAEVDLQQAWDDERAKYIKLEQLHQKLLQTLPPGELLSLLKSFDIEDYSDSNGSRALVQLEKINVESYPQTIEYALAVQHYLEADKREAQIYSEWQDIAVALESKTPDLYMSLFAGRRFSEGGDRLVEMYIKIAQDFLDQIKKAKPPVELISFEVRAA
jgi:hypothetical protein